MSQNLYIWNVLNKLGTDRAECSMVANGKRVADVIKSLINARDSQLECTKVLHETLLVVFM